MAVQPVAQCETAVGVVCLCGHPIDRRALGSREREQLAALVRRIEGARRRILSPAYGSIRIQRLASVEKAAYRRSVRVPLVATRRPATLSHLNRAVFIDSSK